jgi:hypothetical protein
MWLIYPFWLAMFLKGEFMLWTGGLVLVLFLLALAFVTWFDQDLVAQGLVIVIAAAAVVGYVFRWSREFLIRMIVDYDANNGDGRVIIQRFVPSPTEPEYVQFPLQQAAEGSPEINTRGLINTLITQLKVFKGLRAFTIGDLTLRGPAAPFGLTMRNIRDPGAVRGKLDADWKKIAALKAKEKAKRDREEEIARMRMAVTDGIVEAFKMPEVQSVVAPPPPPPPPVSMEWTPASALRLQDVPPGTSAEAGGKPMPDPHDTNPEPEEGSEGDVDPMDDPASALRGRMPPPSAF